MWLAKKRRWGLDLEWLWPVTDRRTPNGFFYRGGDAAPGVLPIGAWTLGTSFAYGKHLFQVFVTNNREIHLDLAAPAIRPRATSRSSCCPPPTAVPTAPRACPQAPSSIRSSSRS